MELKTYADILALHAQFAKEIEQRTAGLRKELRKSPEALIAAKRAAMKQVQERSKAIERSKKELVTRLDAQLDSLRRDAQQLESELGTLESGGRIPKSGTSKASTSKRAKAKK